jgi:hypothetical protein
MQGRGRRLGSSTATITSDLELLTPSRRAPKYESELESEHEYTSSSDNIQDKAIDTLKNDIPESLPPRVIFSPEIEIPEGVQPLIMHMSDRDGPEDMNNKLISILQNNVLDDSPLYVSVQKVHDSETANNIVTAMSVPIMILIIVGVLVYVITKVSN